MTLIAATSNFGHPILIGDILLTSAADEVDGITEIPTQLGSVNHRLPVGQRFLPAGLCRKIYIVTDQLAVGLAGDEWAMKRYLCELKNYFGHMLEVTVANIEAFCQEYGAEEFPNCSALLLYVIDTPDGKMTECCCLGKWQHQTSPLYENILACGSGSRDFLEHASAEWRMPLSSNPQGLFQAISRQYSLLSTILAYEHLNLETIKKYWGASFEMIYYDGERFRTMDDITIVLWRGTLNIETGGYSVSPALFYNYQYSADGDILVINASNITTRKAYGVLPLYLRKEEVLEETLPQQAHFDARKICFCYILEVSDRQTVGSETMVDIVAPTFFTETPANADLMFVSSGEQSPFSPSGETIGIPNLGHAKADIDINGNIVLMVQEGVTEQVIENMRQTLLRNI